MEKKKLKENDQYFSKHKHKKKKHSHKKKKTRKSDSSVSDSDESEWIEAPAAEIPNKTKTENKRDDWMNEELFVATLSKEDMRAGGSSRQRKLEVQTMKKEKDEAIQRERELNPHWKDNGTGLPETQVSAENLTLPSTSVGDGGYSYLKKAYYRIMEQSQQDGRSMEEIAVERWGSLDKLIALIKEAEERMKQNSKTKYCSDKYQREDSNRKSDRHYHRPPDSKRSPSYSPDRSFKYQKPKHSDRKKDKRLCHFSSADRKRYEKNKYDFDNSDSESDLKKHSSSVNTRDSQDKNNYENSDRVNVPAWKKVKSDKKDSAVQYKTRDVFVWDKKSSDLNEAPLFNNKSSEVSNWKKTNKNQDNRHSSKNKDYKSYRSASSDEEDVIHEKAEIPPENTKSFPNITSEDDLNKLAARCTKAEIMGDVALAANLKKQLDEAREALKSGDNICLPQREKERVMLTKVDSSGQERPIYYSDNIQKSQTKQMKKQAQKFYDDGSRYSLNQMFEREKLTTVDDNIEMFMEVAAKCKDADDENETSAISKKATNKMAHHLQEEKDVSKAIHQHQKRNAALEKCGYCLDQPNMKRHLIVKKLSQVYLCIPDFQSLVEGHCLIVPNRHVQSFLALDEEEWREVEDLKLSVRNMFQKQDKNIIIVETSKNFKYYPHTYLEVIPVPEEISDMAPLYFKKAILESEMEWANNVKLIDLSKKGLRRSVPKNLPYFCVLFDPKVHAGYAHVIEDEKSFERNFGKEVIGGMLDIDYNYLFKNRKEDPSKKSKETLQFIKMWESHVDCDSS